MVCTQIVAQGSVKPHRCRYLEKNNHLFENIQITPPRLHFVPTGTVYGRSDREVFEKRFN